jgi:GPH family glycoside/pentoside/hexuronide:cation symporter
VSKLSEANVTANLTANNIQLDEEKKEEKTILATSTVNQFGVGVWKSYFSTYIAMLYTDIYVFPVMLAGLLELLTQLISWFSGPIFGIVVDHVTFKKGKYWQWIALGAIGVGGINALIFAIPLIAAHPESLAFLIFILAAARALFQPMADVSIAAVFPRLATTPEARSKLSAGKSVGMRTGQTVGGAVAPILLVFFASFMSEKASWSMVANVWSIVGIVCYAIFFVTLRNSRVEREVVAEKAVVKKKTPMTVVLKCLITNKALLVVFLFQVVKQFYYFFQSYTGTYFYRYNMQNMAMFSPANTAKMLASVLGLLSGVYALKLLKDSKRVFVVASAFHTLALGVSCFFTTSIISFVAWQSLASYFLGIAEVFVVSFFAAASDFGTWKSGQRADGLNMSAYTLGLTIASAASIAVRSALLNSVGYDAAAYAGGAAVPQSVLNMFAYFQAHIPFALSIVAVLLMAFLFPLNDDKIRKVRDDLKEREAAVRAQS